MLCSEDTKIHAPRAKGQRVIKHVFASIVHLLGVLDTCVRPDTSVCIISGHMAFNSSVLLLQSA